jgi:DNA mismatch repair ATPase MutS
MGIKAVKNKCTIMSFRIDKQSLDELSLLGKFRQGSVYFIFNKIKTRIGERNLDTMFNHPLLDPAAINQRTASFRFFQQARFGFPFDPSQVASMREYVDTTTGGSPVSIAADFYFKKLLALLAKDERYKTAILHLQATIVTLKKCYQFVEEIRPVNSPIQKDVDEIIRILSIPDVRKLIERDIYKSMSVSVAAQFDYFIRNKYNAEIKKVITFIGEVDVYIAVSDVARERGFSYAKAVAKEENSFNVQNLRHPCIQKAIGNDIRMKEGSNVIFLTGANMAGKSTWMKSIGIGMYLAHIGFPVAADAMEFSVREGIYSSINVADNINLGYSHFYAEVVRVKNAALAAATGQHLLLMFDELFKGTNVKDAYDGTLAVSRGFSEYNNCLFIVSTHIIEVGEELQDLKNVQFNFMPTILENNVPKYTYRLQEGITVDRQGMMIIENEGIIDLINP